MAHFVMSAFADEAATDLDGQIEALMEEDISMIELRGVDGVNCADLSKEDAARIHKKLKEHHISLSALGSPYGKISIADDFEEHLAKFMRSLEVCDILECSRIRMFSFYMPEGEKPEKYRDEVMNRLEKMVDMAQKSGILLVHENEKGIYGDNDIRCKELYNYFGGRMGVCFDPANYVQCKVDPMEAYWCYLLHRAYGLHIFFFLHKAFYPVLNDHGYQSHDLCDKAYEQMAFWRHYFYVCREVPVFWHLLHVSGLLQ